jgi:hypothetical protein
LAPYPPFFRTIHAPTLEQKCGVLKLPLKSFSDPKLISHRQSVPLFSSSIEML